MQGRGRAYRSFNVVFVAVKPDILRYGMKRAHIRVRPLPCGETDDSRAYRSCALPGPHLDDDDGDAYADEGQSSQKKDDFHFLRLWRGVLNSLRFLCDQGRYR